MWLLGAAIRLCLVLWEAAKPLHLAFPSAMNQSSSFSASSSAFSFVRLLKFLLCVFLRHVSWHLIVSVCSLLVTSGHEHLSTCLLAICASSVVRCSYPLFAHFLCSLLSYWIFNFHCMFLIQVNYQICVLQRCSCSILLVFCCFFFSAFHRWQLIIHFWRIINIDLISLYNNYYNSYEPIQRVSFSLSEFY